MRVLDLDQEGSKCLRIGKEVVLGVQAMQIRRYGIYRDAGVARAYIATIEMKMKVIVFRNGLIVLKTWTIHAYLGTFHSHLALFRVSPSGPLSREP